MPDLDKGGNYSWTMDSINMGPTKGIVLRPTRNEVILTTGNSYTVQKWDSIILLNLAVKVAFTFNLPKVLDWMSNEWGQTVILFKLLNDNGGNSLTFTPVGPDTIDGQATITALTQINMAPFTSFAVRPRMDLLGWIIT